MGDTKGAYIFNISLKVNIYDDPDSHYVVEVVEPDGSIMKGNGGLFCADELQLACTVKRIRDTLMECKEKGEEYNAKRDSNYW